MSPAARCTLLATLALLVAGCAGPGVPAGPRDFRDCLEGNAPSGHPVAVQVTGPDGSPAAGACVTASLPGSRVVVQQRADAQGEARLRLPGGEWSVRATLALPDDPSCAWVNRTTVLVQGPANVSLALPEAPRACR